MSDTTVAEVQRLVQEGRAAALAGDNLVARSRFRQATELDANSAEAWFGLSSVVPMLAEKREYLQRVLEMDPGNSEAHASLEYVEKLQSEGMQLAPSKRREELNVAGDASPLLSSPEPEVVPEVEYCYQHPDRETGLRCVQCNRAVCGECAKPASVGQLCPECRRQRRPPNYQVSVSNMIVGGLVGFFVSLIMGIFLFFISSFIGFFFLFLLIFFGPAIAELIIRVVDRVTGTKRGREMQITIGTAIAMGTLPVALLNPFLFLYLAIAVVTAVTRMK
ncbi:MAG: hypothetical protein AAGF95_15835 [Chloroflexota bacterium]